MLAASVLNPRSLVQYLNMQKTEARRLGDPKSLPSPQYEIATGRDPVSLRTVLQRYYPGDPPPPGAVPTTACTCCFKCHGHLRHRRRQPDVFSIDTIQYLPYCCVITSSDDSAELKLEVQKLFLSYVR